MIREDFVRIVLAGQLDALLAEGNTERRVKASAFSALRGLRLCLAA